MSGGGYAQICGLRQSISIGKECKKELESGGQKQKKRKTKPQTGEVCVWPPPGPNVRPAPPAPQSLQIALDLTLPHYDSIAACILSTAT